MAEALPAEQVMELAYDGTQDTYHAIRRRQADEVAKLVATAVPWPKRRLSTWHIRPAPGTDEDGDPQD